MSRVGPPTLDSSLSWVLTRRTPVLSAEEHVGQQLQQIGLAYHGPEEKFSDEAGRDALQHGGREENSSEALPVTWVKELDHLPEGVLSFLLQAFNKQSCLQIWDICEILRQDIRVAYQTFIL